MSGCAVVSISFLGISPDHQDLCHDPVPESHGWDVAQAGAWWPHSTLRGGLSTLGRVSWTPNPSLPIKVRVEREQHWEPFPRHVPGQGGCSPVPMELLIGEGWKIQMPGSDVSSETTRTANYCPPRLLPGLPGKWRCHSSRGVGDSGATATGAENTPETLGSTCLPWGCHSHPFS